MWRCCWGACTRGARQLQELQEAVLEFGLEERKTYVEDMFLDKMLKLDDGFVCFNKGEVN